jgi:hypothetical protein
MNPWAVADAIAGGATGAALMVTGRAGALLISRGSYCYQGSDVPVPAFPDGPCMEGVQVTLGFAAAVAVVAGVLAVVLLVRGGWAARAVVVIALVPGTLAGQSLFPAWRGPQLAAAWTAPGDQVGRMSTAGTWTAGGSLIVIRADEDTGHIPAAQVISYDAATGRVQWTLPLPSGNVPCAISGTSGSAIGLLGYGQLWGVCDHVVAIDLRAGRQLWSSQARDGLGGMAHPPSRRTEQ